MAICRGGVHHRTRKSDEQEGQMEATRPGDSVTQGWILLTSHTKDPGVHWEVAFISIFFGIYGQ